MGKIALPTSKTTPQVALSDWRILFVGWPKSGKTTLASYFPRPVFLKTERGTQALSVWSIPQDPKEVLETWTEVGEAVELLKAEAKDKYDTVIIDTLDELFAMLIRQVAKDHGVEHISKLAYGQGWEEAKVRMKKLLEAIYQDFGVVLICHAKSVEESRGAVKINRVVPSLSGSMRDVILGWVDHTIYLEVRNEQTVEGEEGREEVTGSVRRHWAVCALTEYVEAGGRLHHFPMEFPLGDTPAEGFTHFSEEFEHAAALLLEEYEEKVKPNKASTRKRRTK